jgi:hypothetical protein
MRLLPPPLVRSAALGLLIAALACSIVEEGGLGAGGDGGVGDAAGDSALPVRAGASPLPQTGAKSIAVWVSAGGGAAAAANAVVGVVISCPATSNSLAAPSGAQVTLGHFVDTLE